MRVAFDEQIFAIQRHGGISRVFAELAREFTRDTGLAVDLEPIDAPVVNEHVLRDRDLAARLGLRPARHWSSAIARTRLRPRRRGEVEVVHGTFYLPWMLGDYPQARRVTTVHDMIPELFPETHRRLDIVTRKRAHVMAADHIIAVSAATRDDLRRLYPDARAPVTVVHHGVSPEFRPDAPPVPGLPPSYVLFVGMRGGYKDADTLLRAFAAIAAGHPDVDLVLAGGGGLSSREQGRIDALGLGRRVHHVQVRDEQLPGLYAQARVFVLPSQYEGFGLPAIEAMACGTPVILSRSSSLPEVGGDAARYVDTGDDEALARELSAILDDSALAATLSEQGRRRAAEFTWQRAARQTADVYREVLGS